MLEAIMKIQTTSSSVTFECGNVAIIGNGEFGLHQEKWMVLSCMPTLCDMKTGRSFHGMNRKI